MKPITFLFLFFITLSSCKTTIDDFVGKHTFYTHTRYTILDTTKIIKGKYDMPDYFKIQTEKAVPINIDIFKNGTEYKGTISMIHYDSPFLLDSYIKEVETKINIENIHLVNDSLYFDYSSENFFTGRKTSSFNIYNNGGNYYLTIENSNIDSLEIKCNPFVLSNNNNELIYKSIDSEKSKASEIERQINECLSLEIFKRIKSKYKEDELIRIKELLQIQ